MVKRRSRDLLLMGVILLTALPTWAQVQPVGGIRGLVYDRDFNVPMSGVTVIVAETSQRATTQEGGSFVIPEIAAGTYTLIFTKDGFERQVKANVSVAAGSMAEVEVRLVGEVTEMETVNVQDVKPEAQEVLQVAPPPPTLPIGTEAGSLQIRMESAAVMDNISITAMKQAGASTAAEGLKFIPGTSVQDGKYATIRGLPDRYVNSQMNGVRLPTADVDKRAVQLDQFPAAIIDSIQVTKTFTPDQQGDASGGAVNVVLKGVPDHSFLQIGSQTTYNTQTSYRSDFLSYRGGGVNFLGMDDGGRDIPGSFLQPGGGSTTRAVGVSERDAPVNYKWNFAGGIVGDCGDDLKVGGLLSLGYEHNSSSYRNARNDKYFIQGGKVYPYGYNPYDPTADQTLQLYDVSQSKEEVKWSELIALGIEHPELSLSVVKLHTQAAEDIATLSEGTRGKAYMFPGYDPNNLKPSDTAYYYPMVAPYTRAETLLYRERATDTLQFHGRHVLPLADFGIRGVCVFSAPELDWTVALSSATLNEPDKRMFETYWLPAQDGAPATYQFPYKGNLHIGAVQHMWKDINEDSTQYMVNLKYPFKQWSDSEGYLKIGIFDDDVNRSYSQHTFSNADTSVGFEGDWNDFWSSHYPYENRLIISDAKDVDADYTGAQKISAFYFMGDVPLTTYLNVIGGLRFESTQLDTKILVDPKNTFLQYLPPGSSNPIQLKSGAADVNFKRDDVLPSIGLVLKPIKDMALRATYAETTARQTFKELTPIQQQEYAGGPLFIGNPMLKMSSLKNYDLRLDYTPWKGALFSSSYFHKDVKDPIEYVQSSYQNALFTTPVNYPKGKIDGVEMEVRQDLGEWFDGFEGLSIGGNATLIKSQVTVPHDFALQFHPAMHTRDMTNAPSLLYNIYANYDIKETDTHLSLYYSVRGDTLIAGAGSMALPNVYDKEYGTLNFSVTQKLWKYITIGFQAKNLTDPKIQSVYRSNLLNHDVLRTSHTNGIDLSLSISASFDF